VAVDRRALREEIHALYRREHEAMGEAGTIARLERARQWDLAPTLAAGGVLVFPHAGVLDCGHQQAAVVRACLDCGAERVIVISVLHAFTLGGRILDLTYTATAELYRQPRPTWVAAALIEMPRLGSRA
jgi:hypothetical protein